MGYALNRSVTASEVANALKLEVRGNPERSVTSVAPLSEKLEGCLTFCKDPDALDFSCVGILDKASINELGLMENATILVSSNPRLAFMRALAWLSDNVGFAQPGNSQISVSATVGDNVVIEDGCVIDDDVVIEHNVVVHSRTRIGKGSRIRSGAVIGSDGFGFERDEHGVPVRFPHLGGVTIGRNVEIGALTAVARGTLSDTVIEDNAKVDNLVHVAHNCVIKNGAFVIACAELSGGVVVERNAWVAPGVSVNQKLVIGEEAIVGTGSVITKNVAPGTVVAGNPGKRLR